MMPHPYHIFLQDDQFITVIEHQQEKQVELIHPFDTEQRLMLKGEFSEQLLHQLHMSKQASTSMLKIIEKQHAWLRGLSASSLKPSSLQKMVIGDALGLLFLEITDQCNERCIHCYASSSPECHDFLSLIEIKSILKQARSLGQAFVQFTGGDPLIHRHLVEAVAYANALDFQDIEIYTNGLLLHETLLEKLLPYHPMMAFSLYSPDAATHDNITQVAGSFKRTVAAIHRTQRKGIRVRIGMAIMQQNAGHESAMLDFARATFSLTEKSVRFDPVHQTGRGKTLNTQHISLRPSQNSHVPEQQQQQHQVIQLDHEKNLEDPTNFGRRGKLAVCANGNVAPCIFNRTHVLGNIRDLDLLEMLNNDGCNGNMNPSISRWNQCQNNLSCADCQMVAYTLGEKNE